MTYTPADMLGAGTSSTGLAVPFALQPAAPVATRIDAIDVLRGLALFGVLAINLVDEFRVSIFEQFLPPSGPTPLPDRVVAAFLSIAIDFKAFALFSILFGMGLAIQFDHFSGRANRLALLLRRLMTLLAFGLIHLLFIWNGDILTEYAVVGLVVLPLLFLPRPALAAAAAAALLLYLAMPWLPLPWSFPTGGWLRAHIATAREIYGHGSWIEIQVFRVVEIPAIAKLHGYVFPRTIALMLMGALAWRSGFLARARAHAHLLRRAAMMALVSGFALSLLAKGMLAPLDAVLPRPVAIVAGALAPVVLAVGYAVLVIWVVTSTRRGALLTWAAPVGRMAFTNYLVQSVVLSQLFYGYGLGLMGRLGTVAGFALAVVIYAVQALASRAWLRGHLFGPLEWLWRTAIYGRRQPWRKHRARGPDLTNCAAV